MNEQSPPTPTLAAYKALVADFLLLGDDGIVDVITAAVIGNRLDHDAIWLMITGPSSSGKTELLNPLSGLGFVVAISDLTVNTFASGYKMGGGKEASLLLSMQNGILMFKDFTSLLSKRRETRDEIMGQMRHVYDGEYEKRTGTGDEIKWKGKIGAIAASTTAVYHTLAESTEMGQRFIYYAIKQPDRFEAAIRAQDNAKRSSQMRALMLEEYKMYISFVLERVDEGKIEYDPPEDMKLEMLRVADFASLARSPVHTDFKSGLVDMRVDKEMPGRIVKQLNALAAAFIAMNNAEGIMPLDRLNPISPHQRKTLYRCAYDSIPDMRRMVLRLLAQYRFGVTTAGAAVTMELPTESARKYLYQLNAIGVCDRTKERGQGDRWVMRNEEYRRVVQIVEGIVPEDKELRGNDTDLEDLEENFDSYQKAKEQSQDESFMPRTSSIDDF